MNHHGLLRIRELGARLCKSGLPPSIFYKLRNILVRLEEAVAGSQLVMALPTQANLPDLKMIEHFDIRSFKEYPRLEDWVRIVNGSVGEWDLERARYIFLGDKYFSPELCLMLFDDGIPVATASGRIRVLRGERIGELHMVAVKPAYRRKGLGSTISLAALHAIRSVHGGRILLKTDPWRIPAIKMYWKMGFRPLLNRWRFRHQKQLWDSIRRDVKDFGMMS